MKIVLQIFDSAGRVVRIFNIMNIDLQLASTTSENEIDQIAHSLGTVIFVARNPIGRDCVQCMNIRENLRYRTRQQ